MPTSARDGHHLALCDRQGVAARFQIEVDPEFGERRLGGLAHGAIADQLGSTAQQRVESDVLGHGHFGKPRQVLPDTVADSMDGGGLLVGPGAPSLEGAIDLGVIRQAMREEKKLRIAYSDAGGEATERVIWPVALWFSETVRVLAAWCELRGDFRHFRIDRIGGIEALAERLPRRRRALMREWRRLECLAEGERG